MAQGLPPRRVWVPASPWEPVELFLPWMQPWTVGHWLVFSQDGGWRLALQLRLSLYLDWVGGLHWNRCNRFGWCWHRRGRSHTGRNGLRGSGHSRCDRRNNRDGRLDCRRRDRCGAGRHRNSDGATWVPLRRNSSVGHGCRHRLIRLGRRRENGRICRRHRRRGHRRSGRTRLAGAGHRRLYPLLLRGRPKEQPVPHTTEIDQYQQAHQPEEPADGFFVSVGNKIGQPGHLSRLAFPFGFTQCIEDVGHRLILRYGATGVSRGIPTDWPAV